MENSEEIQKNSVNLPDWTRWAMQTARKWEDISEIIKKTGIESIDAEHKRLVEIALEINKLIDLMEKNQFDLNYINKQKILLDDLYKATEHHFHREEEMIKGFGLSQYELQVEQHEKILSMLRSAIQDFQAGRLNVSLSLKLEILDWIVSHVNLVDYETFCLQHWTGGVLDKAEKWEDVFEIVKSTQIEEIDAEHREMAELTMDLLRLINDNGNVKSKHQNQNIKNEIFEKLYQCAASHFAHEEAIMQKFALEGFDDHKAAHLKFLEHMDAFRKDYSAGKLELSSELKTTILEWWINHINDVDYKTFFEGNWAAKVMEKAKSWDDVSGIIKPIGIQEIDKDHKEMTETALELTQLIDQYQNEGNVDSKDVQTIFDRLYQHAASHFGREERIIDEKGYPGKAKQVEQHQKFLDLLSSYRSHLVSGRLGLSPKLKTAILDWWINHINGQDYKSFVEQTDE
ncbi:MAG: hemerythrin family protein [SAR324 cluster bacterium]|nr:hemerythrin family protein [SAR324 cluster bacterium]